VDELDCEGDRQQRGLLLPSERVSYQYPAVGHAVADTLGSSATDSDHSVAERA